MAVTPEDLAAVGLGTQDSFPCPKCGKVYDDERNMRRHAALAHKSGASSATASRERPKTSTGKVVASEARAREEVDKAVGTMIGLGSIMAGAGILPYTGLTIAGVQDKSGAWVVRSRAVIAGGVLFEHAKRDARVLEAVIRFNRIFEGSALVDVAGSLVAAVAVDAGTPPELEVGLGRFQFQPIRSAIGDVVDFVKENSEPPPETPEPSENGASYPTPPKRKRGAAKVVEGGVTAT